MCIFAVNYNRQIMEQKFYPNRLRVVLAQKSISNKWLAEQIGVSEMTVSRWKTNKIQPSMSQFVNIANILNVELKDLIESNT